MHPNLIFLKGYLERKLPSMQPIKLLRDAIERRRENKILNIGYRTPLTVRNVDRFVDKQYVDESCDPKRFDPSVRVTEWIQSIQEE